MMTQMTLMKPPAGGKGALSRAERLFAEQPRSSSIPLQTTAEMISMLQVVGTSQATLEEEKLYDRGVEFCNIQSYRECERTYA